MGTVPLLPAWAPDDVGSIGGGFPSKMGVWGAWGAPCWEKERLNGAASGSRRGGEAVGLEGPKPGRSNSPWPAANNVSWSSSQVGSETQPVSGKKSLPIVGNSAPGDICEMSGESIIAGKNPRKVLVAEVPAS